MLALTSLILAACGKGDLEPDVRGSASNEIDQQYLDSSRARQALGWEPTISLDQGLRRSVQAYRAYFDDHGYGD